jgi:hypothetical protein
VAKRKRAKGAGRKSKGEFHGMRNPLSIRITDALREKLDGACKASGRSLTQEVTRRLDDSFGIKGEPDPRVRAITYLIGQVTLYTGKEWRTNPWMFQAFKAAVSLILEKLAPPGEPIPPELAKQIGAKIGVPPGQLESMMPEGFGFLISEIVWTVLTTMPELPPGMIVPSGSWGYAMPQAREALGVAFDQPGSIANLERIAANMKEDKP